MSAREELAGIIGGKLIMRSSMTETADAILAAGYRKPRTITTAKELDALPEGSIVAGDWATYQLVLGSWVTLGGPGTVQPTLPATVLHEPEKRA